MTTWEPNAPHVVAWIQGAVGVGARVVSAERLAPSATEKHLILVGFGDVTIRLVLRRYHDAERRGVDPWYVASNEARALELLASTPVPAPTLIASDVEAQVCDVPALLESWVVGEQAWRPNDLDAYLGSAADVLVAIHAIDAPDVGAFPRYVPYFESDGLAEVPVPRWSGHRVVWERAIEVIGGPSPSTASRFIHRDYHPGNALWNGTLVSGVVDWATAAIGPPGIDLARMRQNLASWHGREAADRFTDRYVEAGGDPEARDPYWDLLDAADSVASMDEPDAPGSGDVERFERYVEAVLAEC